LHARSSYGSCAWICAGDSDFSLRRIINASADHSASAARDISAAHNLEPCNCCSDAFTGSEGVDCSAAHCLGLPSIDFVYRTASAVTGYRRLCAWLYEVSSFTVNELDTRAFPLLKTISEEHVFYKNAQSQLVECLWGKEVQQVRDRYLPVAGADRATRGNDSRRIRTNHSTIACSIFARIDRVQSQTIGPTDWMRWKFPSLRRLSRVCSSRRVAHISRRFLD